MNWEKITTLVAILGVIVLAMAGIILYGTEGKDVTMNAISGLLGFAGGISTGGAIGYSVGQKINKEGE